MPKDSTAENQWTDELRRECAENAFNGCVGTVLVSETAEVRVWHLHLPPGKRCTFHRHVLNYFWTCHSTGRARGYFDDGRVTEVDHYPGQTKHFRFGPGDYMLHSVENIGKNDLLFTTVEFLNSNNPPLTVPEAVRLTTPSSTR
jgi:hypothetical protein